MVNAGRLFTTWITVIILYIIYLLVYMSCDGLILLLSDVLNQTLGVQYLGLNNWIMTIWTFSPIIVLFLITGWGIFNSLSEEFDSDFGDLR